MGRPFGTQARLMSRGGWVRRSRLASRLGGFAGLALAALLLAGCGDGNRFAMAPTGATASIPVPKPARLMMPQTPATEREHDRILASYGGTYDDPKLEELITKTVNRLVSASDRPDL